MKAIFFLFVSMFSLQRADCQTDKDVAVAQLKKLAQAYRSIPYLSFEVKYRYSPEDSPNDCRDSLTGNFKICGDKFIYSISNTEVVHADSLSLVFYHEDSLIYLSKTSGNLFNNPISMIDSISETGKYQFTLVDTKSNTLITIKPQNTDLIREITYDVDNRSGLIRHIKQVVSNKMMYAANVEAGDGGYAVIKIDFNNYSTKPFDPSIFNRNKYINIVDGNYQAAYPYNLYKVFNGNINL